MSVKNLIEFLIFASVLLRVEREATLFLSLAIARSIL